MVRHFFPQAANSSIVANTNFTPQNSDEGGVTPLVISNWIDNSSNQMVDDAGNNLVFVVDERINELPDGNATFTPTARIPYEDANDDTNTTKFVNSNSLLVLDADNVFTGFNTFPTILATQNYEFSDLSTQEEGAVTFPFGSNITTSVFLQSLPIITQDDSPRSTFIRADGKKMYVAGATNDRIFEYDLATAWDISVSSASFLQSFDVSGEDTIPVGLFFRSDGKKMYMIGTATDSIYEYDLATAWDIDISSVTLNQSFSVSGQDVSPTDMYFHPDGKKMYVVGTDNDSVYEYDLATAWDIDISSVTFNQSFSVSGQDTAPNDIFFRSDGKKMYMIGSNNDNVYEYDLTTPWDISTATFIQSFNFITQDNNGQGVFFKPDMTKMYISGNDNNAIFEYDLGISTDGSAIFNGRIQESEGAAVASADIITLGNANIFEITGMIEINHMTTIGWQEGSEVTLRFADTLNVISSSLTPPTDTESFFLDGNVTFGTSANATLSLTLAGGFWRETSRSLG